MSDQLDQKHIYANLASLNEVVGEILAAMVEHGIGDAGFRDMATSILQGHSWALGYQFRGESGQPPEQPSGPDEDTRRLIAVLLRKLGGRAVVHADEMAHADPNPQFLVTRDKGFDGYTLELR